MFALEQTVCWIYPREYEFKIPGIYIDLTLKFTEDGQRNKADFISFGSIRRFYKGVDKTCLHNLIFFLLAELRNTGTFWKIDSWNAFF